MVVPRCNGLVNWTNTPVNIMKKHDENVVEISNRTQNHSECFRIIELI